MSIQIKNSIFSKFLTNNSAPEQNIQPKVNLSDNVADVYEKNNAGQKSSSGNLYKWLGGIALAVAAAFGIRRFLVKKGAKVLSDELPALPKAFEEFVNTMNPKNKRIAGEFFEVLEKNADNFSLKKTDYNGIFDVINNDNKAFLKSDLFPMLEKYGKALKDLGADDGALADAIQTINKENKPLFEYLLDNYKNLKVTVLVEILDFVKQIEPSKQNFLLKELLPVLERNTAPDKLNLDFTAITFMAPKITPKTMEVVDTVAKYYQKLSERKINLLSIFNHVDENNYKTVQALLENLDELGITSKNGFFKKYLSFMTNDKADLIKPFAQAMPGLKNLNINQEELFKLLTPKNVKVLSYIAKNPELYSLTDANVSLGLKKYLTQINPDRIERLHNEVIPKLKEYDKLYPTGFDAPDLIADAVQNLSDKSYGAVDLLFKYGKQLAPLENDSKYMAWFFLSRVNDNNIQNVDFILKNYQRLPIDSCCSDEFMKIIDLPLSEIKKLVK